jgi:L-asparaginase / beta-aspartyl-peptidase
MIQRFCLQTLMVSVMLGICALCGCTSKPAPSPDWVLVIHGGAGTLDPDASPAELQAYRQSLAAALAAGSAVLSAGGSSVDAVEAAVRVMEDDPGFNAGKGAALTIDGRAELDAAIIDGSTMKAGAVTGVTTVKNPISLARMVKEKTRFILFARDGAERFADEQRVERVDNSWFVTPRRQKMLDEHKAQLQTRSSIDQPSTFGTVGALALDIQGRLAAATSTGGLTGKMFGRIGDSPLIGSGTYANAFVAVSCTGTGEQFIRHAVASTLAARIELKGESVDQAANHMIHNVLNKDDGGLIALDRHGHVAMPYSTVGMYRGVARKERSANPVGHVAIFAEQSPVIILQTPESK